MLGKNLFLFLDSACLIDDVTFQALHVVPNVFHLILDQLEFSFRLQSHVVDLTFVFLVFVLNSSELLITILFNLRNGHRVSLD